MSRKVYIACCCVTIFILFSISALLLASENFDSVPIIDSDNPCSYIIHRTEYHPREEIASCNNDKSKIYIFYEKTALVNVYGTDGSFKYGIQVPSISNGKGKIAVSDKRLYIFSRRGIIYIFEDEQLSQIVGPNKNKEIYKNIRMIFVEQDTDNNEYDYELDGLSNNIVRKDTRETVIDLPERSREAEYLLLINLLLLSFAIIGYTKLFENR